MIGKLNLDMVSKMKILALMSLCCLMSCSGPHPKQEQKTYTVRLEPLHKTLHFTGTVQPLQEQSLTSPMEGVVQTIYKHYGESVKKGEAVFMLTSTALQKQYNETLTEYLKAKDSYSIARAKFTGTEDLWTAGLISKNNYMSEKSSLNTSRVTLMQATAKLSDMLGKVGDEQQEDLSHLSFSEFDKVRLVLGAKHDVIHIKSLSDGVLLYPPKANDDKALHLGVGSTIKSGQVLALVGDLSGLRLDIDVPEIDLDKVKPGMLATIHGVAFAAEQLKGQLVSVNAQASAASPNTLPSFKAWVEVRDLDAKQQALIKVGMSANIELAVESANKILVPIAAVSQKKGQNVVRVQGKTGHTRSMPVITGTTYGDRVLIESGLHVGDVIIYE